MCALLWTWTIASYGKWQHNHKFFCWKKRSFVVSFNGCITFWTFWGFSGNTCFSLACHLVQQQTEMSKLWVMFSSLLALPTDSSLCLFSVGFLTCCKSCTFSASSHEALQPLWTFMPPALSQINILYLFCHMHLNMNPQPLLPGCSRHLLLAVGLVGWAGGHHGLLEALHTPLHGAAHVLLHHIGAPVPEEGDKQRLKHV